MLYFKLNDVDCPFVESAIYARPDNFATIESWGKCNSVTFRRGLTPGEAHLVITKSMRDALNLSTANTIKIIHDGGTVTLPYWFVYSCEAITSGDGTDSNHLFHLHLKDCRFVGEMKTIQETPSAIKDTHRVITGTQPSAVTWQTVLDALWNELPTVAKGTSTSCPTLPTTPASNAENLIFEGVTAWRAICQALAACGYTVTFNPITGAYAFVRYDDAHTGLSTQASTASAYMVWDGFISSTPGAAPENVGVIFPAQSMDSQKIIWYGNQHASSVSSGISGVSGTRIDIVDTTRAERDSGGSLTNNTQITNRIDDLKHTIIGVSRASSQRLVRRYENYQVFTMGGLLTEIEYVSTKSFAGTTIRYHQDLKFDLPAVYPTLPVRWNTRSASRIRATYTSGLSATVIAGIDGPLPSGITAGSTITFTNPQSHYICAGAVINLEQNYATSDWEVYSVPVKNFLTNVYLDGINLKKADSCGTITTIYEGTTCSS